MLSSVEPFGGRSVQGARRTPRLAGRHNSLRDEWKDDVVAVQLPSVVLRLRLRCVPFPRLPHSDPVGLWASEPAIEGPGGAGRSRGWPQPGHRIVGTVSIYVEEVRRSASKHLFLGLLLFRKIKSRTHPVCRSSLLQLIKTSKDVLGMNQTVFDHHTSPYGAISVPIIVIRPTNEIDEQLSLPGDPRLSLSTARQTRATG
ncbi:hypothetical protein K0M31_009627 [Melipona bicolor]|uniref:Uncharacterized protein n=1 Tax=Melipona bicolor TaxID=60889 RepID=A0AA40KJD2_9HYME|nr:hypothetical protein K0M31_009627 [Melipona bicolor]